MYKISDVYGRRIYNESSGFLGVAKDVLLDPAEGKIKFLLKDDVSSMLGRQDEEARKFIKENFIPFEKVKAVGDIIIIR